MTNNCSYLTKVCTKVIFFLQMFIHVSHLYKCKTIYNKAILEAWKTENKAFYNTNIFLPLITEE